MTKQNYNSSKNQRIKERFVGQHIIYNVSYMISELAKNAEIAEEENLYDLMSQDDWETPVDYYIENKMSNTECVDWLNENTEIDDRGYRINGKKELIKCLEDEDQYQEFAAEFDIDPEQIEAYEHWIVSSYLKDKLAEKGKMTGDVLGLDIWGRTTTGQAILLDLVISEICSDMNILEGQSNEWSV